MEMSDLLIFAVIFGLLALMNLYRLIKGPNAADRMVPRTRRTYACPAR